MAGQLLLGNIVRMAEKLVEEGMSKEEMMNLPVYIGDDDELNGIHSGFYSQLIGQSEDDAYFRELIAKRTGNIELKDDKQAVLIS